MKRYEVTIKYIGINRKNSLVIWADDKETAIQRALKFWGNPDIYEWIEAVDTKYV